LARGRMGVVHVTDLPTPALVIDADALDRNIAAMAARRPGRSLRPHVKAHKCTALAAVQAAGGHDSFTCATTREVIGMAAAGLGTDLLLANETVDPARLKAMASVDARVTVAVDSEATVAAAAASGIAEVLIDVNIGLPRCGCEPADVPRLADLARRAGMTVRGVMGYEGHLMMVLDPADRRARVGAAIDVLLAAHERVGGDVISAGGTGTHDLLDRVTEVQAGSYVLMDTQYAQHGHPFEQACWVVGTVIAVAARHAVADVGLKAMAMDHGNPAVVGGDVWFLSDEHVTFAPSPDRRVSVGDRVRVTPAHIDPTMAMHDVAWLVRGDEVIDRWPIDLRGW
jgi:D-serine deaminase-like pyridoxal phosphate-dependent protein